MAVSPTGRLAIAVASCAAVATTASCSSLGGLEQALSPGAGETNTVTSADNPQEVEPGVVLFGATWFESPDIFATDIRDVVMSELRDAGATSTCEESTAPSETPSPAWDCTFTWSDGRDGTFTVRGGGPVPDDFPDDIDAIAINLEATYPEG